MIKGRVKMTEDGFKAMYMGDFTPSQRDKDKYELAKRYHVETERYDRQVCTGPIMHDGILPANHYQRASISRNAIKVRADIMTEAEQLGISRKEMKEAISRFDCRVIQELI